MTKTTRQSSSILGMTTPPLLLLLCLFVKLQTAGAESYYGKGGKKGSSKPKDSQYDAVFVELANADFIENDLQTIGDRIIWGQEPIYDGIGGQQIGRTTGICTLHALDPEFWLLCNYNQVFWEHADSPYAGSTVTYTGNCPDLPTPCLLTITGGTGYFAGRSGRIDLEQPASPDVPQYYIHRVKFE